MKTQTYEPRADYVGTGSLDSYSFNFLATDKSQLKIVKWSNLGVKIFEVSGDDTNYLSSVTLNSDGGGQVVLAADLETDYLLAIINDANEPIFPKDYSKSTYWNLPQFQASFDYIMLQLQAVAYLVKRMPRVSDIFSNENAANFDFQFDIEPDSVVAINEDGDGFVTVARSSFAGEKGEQGDPGTNGTNGTNGLGIERSGNKSLINGQQTVVVTFSSAVSSANYVPSVCWKNSVDSSPMIPQGMITAWDVNGFTMVLAAPVDSANYIMAWSVLDEI